MRLVAPGREAAEQIAAAQIVREFRLARQVGGGSVIADITPLPSDELNSRKLAAAASPAEAWKGLIDCAGHQ